MSGDYKLHPLADIFPLMSEVEFAALVEDIRTHGLKHPITKLPAPDNLIIDGRNRLNACLVAGVPPRFEDFKGGNVLAFIATENLYRRQLSVSLRSLVAARIKRATRGEDWRKIVPGNVQVIENEARPQMRADAARVHADQETAALAEAFNVGKASIERADTVLAKGVPELAAAIDQGKITISKAADIARLPEREQRDHVADILSRRERLQAVSKDNAERYRERNARYERRLPKKVRTLIRGLSEIERRRLVVEMATVDDILARAEHALDSDRRRVAIAYFSHIRSVDERLKVNDAVVAWLQEHEAGDALEASLGEAHNQ
jgi:hypothetical protein